MSGYARDTPLANSADFPSLSTMWFASQSKIQKICQHKIFYGFLHYVHNSQEFL